MDRKVVSRFAPSPTMTGDDPQPHLGFYRTLYHSWLAARASKDGGKFILRIDDTDLTRSTTENIDRIYKAVESMGLDWDETFMQSDNFENYRYFAEQLVMDDVAMYDDGCIRLNKEVMSERGIRCDWTDEISGDKASNDSIKEIAFNQVIIKSDGSPTYNFCTVIDDIESGITDVIRGTDHISNTYKQMVFYRLLPDSSIPKFHHVGLVCNRNGAKLSKRESNEMNLSQYDTDAMLNYVLRLGWGPFVDNKAANIIGKDRAQNMFWTDGKLRAPNSKVDTNKLDWLNKKYVGMKKAQLQSS